MTDLTEQNSAALLKLRALLSANYNTLAPDHARIDAVEIDPKGHVVLIGANPDESLIHSRTGKSPAEVLESFESRM